MKSSSTKPCLPCRGLAVSLSRARHGSYASVTGRRRLDQSRCWTCCLGRMWAAAGPRRWPSRGWLDERPFEYVIGSPNGRSRRLVALLAASRRRLALHRVEPLHDLPRVAHERAGVEDRVEVELGSGLGQQVAEGGAG